MLIRISGCSRFPMSFFFSIPITTTTTAWTTTAISIRTTTTTTTTFFETLPSDLQLAGFFYIFLSLFTSGVLVLHRHSSV